MCIYICICICFCCCLLILHYIFSIPSVHYSYRITKDVNYALTRAICRVSATEDASSASANSTRDEISPHVHVLAFAVIDERCVKIGDHIVCDSEKHSLPVFKLSFPRNVLPPSKDDGEVKQPDGTLASSASILASMALKRLHPSTPKK